MMESSFLNSQGMHGLIPSSLKLKRMWKVSSKGNLSGWDLGKLAFNDSTFFFYLILNRTCILNSHLTLISI